MRALVTGGNGFIGSFLVEKLVQNGVHVRCLVRTTSNLQWIENLDVEFVYGELRDPSSLVPAVRDTDIIYHVGGVTKGMNEEDFMQGNHLSTVNLLNASGKNGPKHQKFVLVSSQAAAGPSRDGKPLTEEDPAQPVSMYGRAKARAEQAVLEYRNIKPVVVVRPPSVYGPRDKDFFLLFKNINRGIVPMVGDGKQKVSLVHVSDLADGIIIAGESERADGQIYFLSADGEFSWNQLAHKIAAALKKGTFTVQIPFWAVDAVSFLAVGWSKITGQPTLLNHDKVLEMKQPAWLCSNEKAKSELGFEPKIDLDDGFKQTGDWYQQHGWL